MRHRGRTVEELCDELNRLMKKHIESLRKQTFSVGEEEEWREEEERLKRIRELSTDYLSAWKRKRRVLDDKPAPEN